MVALGGPKQVEALTPNGVDAEHFAPGDMAAARARLGQPVPGEVVLCVPPNKSLSRAGPIALTLRRAPTPIQRRTVFLLRHGESKVGPTPNCRPTSPLDQSRMLKFVLRLSSYLKMS